MDIKNLFLKIKKLLRSNWLYRLSILDKRLSHQIHMLENRLMTEYTSIIVQFLDKNSYENSLIMTKKTDSELREFLVNKKNYLLEKFGRPSVISNFPVALDSPDHLVPHGTANDNSVNSRFTAKLIHLFNGKLQSVLDLGCSGGAQVRDFIEHGYFAVGLEGSDYSLKQLRAEWLTIPEFLFTTDITKPFSIVNSKNNTQILFDCITLWEVIEHIADGDLDMVAQNLKRHLSPGGLVIMSVSPNEEVINGVKLHQSVHGREWWINRFKDLGFNHNQEYVDYFGLDLVRHEGAGGNAPGSFHLFLNSLNK